MSLLAELQRRNVIRVAVFYIVSAWLFLQVIDLLFEVLLVPDWTLRFLFGVLAVAFPFVLFFAWAYELTPEGLKREADVDRSRSITPRTGRKLDIAVIVLVLLGVAAAYFGADRGVEPSTPRLDTADPNQAVAVTDPPADVSSPVAGRTIAVLPFVNMSSDPEQEFFSDGMTEEILNVLTKIDGLQVSGRTSSFQFKGQNLDLRDIGQRLGVAHILEGSVRRYGDDLRITAQLVQADNGFHLWSETYDRKLANVFAIQDEIARAIADALKVPLGIEAGETLAVARTDDMMAYEIYLRALSELKRRRDGVANAIEMLGTVVERDPGFAPAWAHLALAHAVSPYYLNSNGRAPRSAWLAAADSAEQAARRALRIDPQTALAQVALGNAAWIRHDWIVGETAFERALELDPRSPDAHQQYAEFLYQAGHYERALVHARRAAELDPLTPVVQNVLGYILAGNDQPDAAIEALNFARNLSPMLYFARTNLIALAVRHGRPAVIEDLIEGGDASEGLPILADALRNPELLPQAQDWIRRRGLISLAPYIGIPDFWFESLESTSEEFNGGSTIFGHDPTQAILADPRTWNMIADQGLPAYWDHTGWPPACRRLGPDEFRCGDFP